MSGVAEFTPHLNHASASVTLAVLKRLFRKTKQKVTPHRTPNFDKVRADMERDPPLRHARLFLEENNTCDPGHLERWVVSAKMKAGASDLPNRLIAGDALPRGLGRLN